MRYGLKMAAAGVGLCVATLLWHFHGNSPPSLPAAKQPQVAAGTSSSQPAAEGEPAVSRTQAGSLVAPTPGVTRDAAVSSVAPVDSELLPLIAGLKQLSDTNAALTPEAAGLWRTNFSQLVQKGPAAIPALRAFLDEKNDYPFSRETWQATGYSSARIAAIDALRQIGGSEAVATMASLLSTTSSPREIALLARNLEDASPGQYREQALAAARTGLQAAAASPNPQVDVAPLFEVFQHYGDASSIPDLEQAISQWRYYAAIALANLPDGAGVPSLLRLAEAGSGSRVVALEMVAQLAAENGAAREFLLAQVSGNKIAPNLWPYLTGPLAGDQYFPADLAITQYPQLQALSDLKTTHLVNGNQNFYTLPGDQNLTSGGIQQRLTLVEELLKTASDPAAIQGLQQARDTLAQRASRGIAQTPAGAAGTGH